MELPPEPPLLSKSWLVKTKENSGLSAKKTGSQSNRYDFPLLSIENKPSSPDAPLQSPLDPPHAVDPLSLLSNVHVKKKISPKTEEVQAKFAKPGRVPFSEHGEEVKRLETREEASLFSRHTIRTIHEEAERRGFDQGSYEEPNKHEPRNGGQARPDQAGPASLPPAPRPVAAPLPPTAPPAAVDQHPPMRSFHSTPDCKTASSLSVKKSRPRHVHTMKFALPKRISRDEHERQLRELELTGDISSNSILGLANASSADDGCRPLETSPDAEKPDPNKPAQTRPNTTPADASSRLGGTVTPADNSRLWGTVTPADAPRAGGWRTRYASGGPSGGPRQRPREDDQRSCTFTGPGIFSDSVTENRLSKMADLVHRHGTAAAEGRATLTGSASTSALPSGATSWSAAAGSSVGSAVGGAAVEASRQAESITSTESRPADRQSDPGPGLVRDGPRSAEVDSTDGRTGNSCGGVVQGSANTQQTTAQPTSNQPHGNRLQANQQQASQKQANQLQVNQQQANQQQTSQLQANQLQANQLQANQQQAKHQQANQQQANQLQANQLQANQPPGNQLQVNQLQANQGQQQASFGQGPQNPANFGMGQSQASFGQGQQANFGQNQASFGQGQASFGAANPMMVAGPMQMNPFQMMLINGNHYIMSKLIGRGGSSQVYGAVSPQFGDCAVKVVELGEEEEAVIEGYKNEIELMRRLQDSGRVVRLYDYEYRGTQLLVVMEKGETDLEHYFRKWKTSGRILPEMVKFYWRQMLEAVQVLHKAGIVHSDLKPANFMLVAGMVKLIDFGIANAIQTDRTSVTRDVVMGTLNYLSPEAVLDTQIPHTGDDKPRFKLGVKSDIWSLGCILYTMVYNKTPFHNFKRAHEKLQAITSNKFSIPYPDDVCEPSLLHTLQRCLVRNPRDRASIEELLNHAYLTGVQPDAPV